MQKTEYLELNLPDGDDYYNVEDFNENAQKIDLTIHEMKESFQAGVEACYNACVTKGSTPASYALGDVVQGILDIETSGGSGECYSMFPQEVPDWDLSEYGSVNVLFQNGTDVFRAHVITTSDSLIKLNFYGFIPSPSNQSGTLTLVIDDTTVIPNVGTYLFTSSDPSFTPYSLSYTLTTPLSTGYHTIALRPTNTQGSAVEFVVSLFNLYGTDFTAVQNVGVYFGDGTFASYYAPSNFVNPANPVTYQLLNDLESCGGPVEELDTAMNLHLSNQFDTGVCFHVEGITGYNEYNPETGDYDVIVPSIADSLVLSNGKFVYTHSTQRSFPGDSVVETHYFILPIICRFFDMFDYIYIHGKMASVSGSINGQAKIEPLMFIRPNQSTVDYPSVSDTYQYLDSLSADDEFIIYIETPTLQNNYTPFIGFSIMYISSSDDPFTLEIDKIWGSNIEPEY